MILVGRIGGVAHFPCRLQNDRKTRFLNRSHHWRRETSEVSSPARGAYSGPRGRSVLLSLCSPGIKGNEKGGVEGELGWYRRNCLVPVPEARDLATWNAQLLAACVASRDRTISGKSTTVGEASEYERAFLLPRADEGFPLEEVLYPLVVDSKGRVKVKVNWYSAPLSPGLRVTAVVGPLEIEIRHDNQVAARHARCYGRGHKFTSRVGLRNDPHFGAVRKADQGH